MREIRSCKATELRAEAGADGKQYLAGYAATYRTLSQELNGGDGYRFRERIMPGAFARALQERQDVRHLKNHDPNLVLGRTRAGTLELSDDEKGLKFRTLLPDTTYAKDLAESIRRGDIDECSFAFDAKRTTWAAEGDDTEIRELRDVDLYDISVVTYPAYPNTSAGVGRSLFPEGLPLEIRSRGESRADTSEEKRAAWKKLIALAKTYDIEVSAEEEQSWPGATKRALELARRAVDVATVRLKEARQQTADPDDACETLCRICRDICDSVIWYCYGAELGERPLISMLSDCCYCCNFCAGAVCGESASEKEICSLCALVCSRAAEACSQFPDDAVMQMCAEACAACAQCCSAMTQEPADEDEAAEMEMRQQRVRLALASC